ncbi:MAG: hypothetical protein R3F11_12160 [Verrucomicrobiales bacterium]
MHDVNYIGIDLIGGEADIQPNPALRAPRDLRRKPRRALPRSHRRNRRGHLRGWRARYHRGRQHRRGCDYGISVGAEDNGVDAERIHTRNNIAKNNRKAG